MTPDQLDFVVLQSLDHRREIDKLEKKYRKSLGRNTLELPEADRDELELLRRNWLQGARDLRELMGGNHPLAMRMDRQIERGV